MKLSDKMKHYEKLTNQQLLPLIPIVARVDGKTFHSFCKGLCLPYDIRLVDLMILTTKFLVKETNALVGYTQSDEISLIWHTNNIESQIFFDRKIAKMTSILSAMTTLFFNKNLPKHLPEKQDKNPLFDARVFNVPTKTEAIKYLIWREMDATRNSINQAARTLYSHKQLDKKNSSEKQELLFSKGINWDKYPDYFKRGTYIRQIETKRSFTTEELDKLPEKHEARRNPNLEILRTDIEILNLPPIRQVENIVEVIFEGASLKS